MSKFGYKVIHRHSQNRFVEIWLALSNSGAGDDTEFIQASPMKFFKVPKGMAHQICIYIIFLRRLNKRNIYFYNRPIVELDVHIIYNLCSYVKPWSIAYNPGTRVWREEAGHQVSLPTRGGPATVTPNRCELSG